MQLAFREISNILQEKPHADFEIVQRMSLGISNITIVVLKHKPTGKFYRPPVLCEPSSAEGWDALLNLTEVFPQDKITTEYTVYP